MKPSIHISAANLLGAGLLAAVHPAPAAPQGNGRAARLLNEFTLPPFSLTNFGFSTAELAAAAANGRSRTAPAPAPACNN